MWGCCRGCSTCGKQSKTLEPQRTLKEKPHPSTASRGSKPCVTKSRRLGGCESVRSGGLEPGARLPHGRTYVICTLVAASGPADHITRGLYICVYLNGIRRHTCTYMLIQAHGATPELYDGVMTCRRSCSRQHEFVIIIIIIGNWSSPERRCTRHLHGATGSEPPRTT